MAATDQVRQQTTSITEEGQAARFVSRQLLIDITVLAGSILLFCVACEIGLRIIYANSLDFSMEMWKYAVQLKHTVDDRQLSFAHVPNRSAHLMGVQVSINSKGLRDREYSLEKPPGVYRIVMLGDSTTLGWGVPLEQTVAKILETRLNRLGLPGRRFEVLNAGVGNYDTVQEVTHYLTYDRAFHPDMVVLEYFINDAESVPREKHMFLLGQSYMVAFTASRFDAMLRFTGRRPNWKEYYASLYRDDLPGFKAAKNALAKLAAMSRADSTLLLVALLPELHEINNAYPFTEAHRKIEEVLANERVPAMELIEGLRGHGPEKELWVTAADDHPNGKANSLVAAQMIPWILAHVTPRAPASSANLE